jgi:hypothetical protein
MSIDKVLNEVESGDALAIGEGMPDVEIILEEDGGATVGLLEEEEAPFETNLAEIVDEGELSHIASELSKRRFEPLHFNHGLHEPSCMKIYV